jgi:hypothetical protein
MQGQVADLALSSTRLKPLHLEQRNNYWLLYGLGPWVLFNWTNRYSNVLDKAFLEAQYFYNQPQVPGLMTWEEPRKMKLFRYPFGLLRPGVSGFLDNGGDKREYSVEELAEQLLKTYLDEVENFKRRLGRMRERPATILLPNSVAAGDTGRDHAVPRSSFSPIIRDFLISNGT